MTEGVFFTPSTNLRLVPLPRRGRLVPTRLLEIDFCGPLPTAKCLRVRTRREIPPPTCGWSPFLCQGRFCAGSPFGRTGGGTKKSLNNRCVTAIAKGRTSQYAVPPSLKAGISPAFRLLCPSRRQYARFQGCPSPQFRIEALTHPSSLHATHTDTLPFHHRVSDTKITVSR